MPQLRLQLHEIAFRRDVQHAICSYLQDVTAVDAFERLELSLRGIFQQFTQFCLPEYGKSSPRIRKIVSPNTDNKLPLFSVQGFFQNKNNLGVQNLACVWLDPPKVVKSQLTFFNLLKKIRAYWSGTGFSSYVWYEWVKRAYQKECRMPQGRAGARDLLEQRTTARRPRYSQMAVV